MEQLNATGRYQWERPGAGEDPETVCEGYCCGDEETKRVIAAIHEKFGYPHRSPHRRGLCRQHPVKYASLKWFHRLVKNRKSGMVIPAAVNNHLESNVDSAGLIKKSIAEMMVATR